MGRLNFVVYTSTKWTFHFHKTFHNTWMCFRQYLPKSIKLSLIFGQSVLQFGAQLLTWWLSICDLVVYPTGVPSNDLIDCECILTNYHIPLILKKTLSQSNNFNIFTTEFSKSICLWGNNKLHCNLVCTLPLHSCGMSLDLRGKSASTLHNKAFECQQS